VGGQSHAPAALPPGKTRYLLYRRLGGPQSRSGRVRRISPPTGFDPRTVQPVASRYTDWAIPAPTLLQEMLKTISLWIDIFLCARCHVQIRLVLPQEVSIEELIVSEPLWPTRSPDLPTRAFFCLCEYLTERQSSRITSSHFIWNEEEHSCTPSSVRVCIQSTTN
jgi:hypothetical protein